MLKILHCAEYDPRVWQEALLGSEVQDLLSTLATCDAALGTNSLLVTSDACVLATQTVREAVMRILDQFSLVNRSLLEGAREIQKPVQGALDSECPICFMALGDLQGNPTEPVVFCWSCGNNLHSECFEKWQQTKAQQKLTCVLCRAPWHVTKGGGWAQNLETKEWVCLVLDM